MADNNLNIADSFKNIFLAGIGALSTSAGMLIFGRILTGAGVAVMGVIATTIISMYFPREKAGVPMGLWNLWYTVGATLAYNIGVPICVAFTGNPESWHVWWWFCDAASLVAFVVFLLIVRVPKFATAKRNVAAQSNDKQAQISEENKETDSKSENPSDGLGNNVAESRLDSSSSNGGISGVQATSVDAAIASRNEANNRHRHEVKAGKASTDSTSKSGEIKSYKSDSISGSFRLLIEGWKVPRMWLLGISYACLMFTSLAVLSWVPTYAQDVETARLIAQGVSHADAAMRAAESSGALASIGFASSIPTSLVTAWLLGRFPHIKSRNIMLMIASALGFLYVGAYLIPFDWLPWWLVLLGIESGWTSGVVWALVPLTMPKPSTITVGMATITCATGVSNLLATPIVGYLIGAHDIWTNVPPLLICTACVGVVLCFIYIRTKPPVFEERE